jgi:CDP-diacylglycerol--serine O-phosphatidyltransferase
MKIKYMVPSSITAAALIAGLFSILKSMSGDYMAAAQFLMLSMVLDGLDGNVSRWLKASSDFGAELDTFVDITSFGVAPAVLAYQVLFNRLEMFGLVFVSLIVLSGALRLARFKVIDPDHGQNGYTGLPITVNAGWIAMLVFITETHVLDDKFFNLAKGPMAVFAWTCSLAMILLQVSRVHYTKPTKGVVWFAFCVFAVALLFLRAHIAVAAAFGMIVYGFVYTFVLPLLPHPSALLADEEEEESTTGPF